MQSATPTIRNHPTPAVTLPRGVEDAAPYGRQQNVGIRIAVNRCVNAASPHPPLGSPERGAVAAPCAVTEGLVPAWVQCNNVARQPTQPHPVGAGFHARPASVKGRRGCARMKWCAGGAREIAYVGRWVQGGRAVGEAGATGQAGRLRLTHPGNPANTGRRGRRPLRTAAKTDLRHTT